jgi:hypothetical protein
MNGEYHSYSNINMTIEWERKIILTYMLLGDPEVDIYTNQVKSIEPIFPAQVYEGTNFDLTIQDTDGNPVQFPIVTIYNDDGKYRVFEGQKNGFINIKFPMGVRAYNYTVYGHNVVFKDGFVNVLQDDEKPVISEKYTINPQKPTVDDTLKINLDVIDARSGVSDVYLILTDTKSNYSSYSILKMNAQNLTNPNECSIILKYLKPYDYLFSIVAFDYADNVAVGLFGPTYGQFLIPLPIEYNVLKIFNIIGISSLGLVAVAVVKYPNSLKKKYEAQRISDSNVLMIENEPSQIQQELN